MLLNYDKIKKNTDLKEIIDTLKYINFSITERTKRLIDRRNILRKLIKCDLNFIGKYN